MAGSVNTAADFLSRLELKVTKKIRLKFREDIQSTPKDATTSSSDVADEDQTFVTQAVNQNELEEKTLQRKEKTRQDAKEWVAIEEPSSLKTNVKEFKNTTSYSMPESRQVHRYE